MKDPVCLHCGDAVHRVGHKTWIHRGNHSSQCKLYTKPVDRDVWRAVDDARQVALREVRTRIADTHDD